MAVAIPSKHGAVGPSDGRRHNEEQRQVGRLPHKTGWSQWVPLDPTAHHYRSAAMLLCHAMPLCLTRPTYEHQGVMISFMAIFMSYSTIVEWISCIQFQQAQVRLAQRLQPLLALESCRTRVIRVGIVQYVKLGRRRTAWLQWHGLLRLWVDARIKAAEALRARQGVTCQRSKRSMA